MATERVTLATLRREARRVYGETSTVDVVRLTAYVNCRWVATCRTKGMPIHGEGAETRRGALAILAAAIAAVRAAETPKRKAKR